MEKIVAVFQSQNQADSAIDELTRSGLKGLDTAVYEGRSQDHPTGQDTIPVTGVVPTFVPFSDIDLGAEGDENAEFLGQMYEQGATLVVIDYHDEDAMKVSEILSKHGGRFTRKD